MFEDLILYKRERKREKIAFCGRKKEIAIKIRTFTGNGAMHLPSATHQAHVLNWDLVMHYAQKVRYAPGRKHYASAK